jgi:hypothetical protein
MSIPHEHAMRSRYTGELLRDRLQAIANELAGIHDRCGGEHVSPVCWCLLTVEDAVRVLDTRTAFAADGGRR